MPFSELLPRLHNKYNGLKWNYKKRRRFVDHNMRTDIHVVFVYSIFSVALVIYSVVWWSEFLAANPEVRGSIPGATKFSE
jgi:hypothetical protein